MCSEQKKPHKHAELIKAWADGAEIQYQDPCKFGWKDTNDPTWSTQCEYRIKPKEPIVLYGFINIAPDGDRLYRFVDHQLPGHSIKATFNPDTRALISVEKI